MRSIQWSLTTAGSSIRAAWTIGFIEMKFNIIRSILRIRDTTVLQSSIMIQILKVFCQSKADTLYKTTVEVTLYKKSVHDRSYIRYTGELLNCNLTCFCIDSNFRKENSVHISCKRISLGGILIDRMICTEGCHPVTFIFCCKTFSHHLIISTEGSVFFLHSCHKVFCCQTTCIT